MEGSRERSRPRRRMVIAGLLAAGSLFLGPLAFEASMFDLRNLPCSLAGECHHRRPHAVLEAGWMGTGSTQALVDLVFEGAP